MGLGLVIVLEQDVEGVDPEGFDGSRLASERHALDAIAHEYDLRGLGEFVAFSMAEAETLAEDMKFDTPTAGRATGRWFPSRQGLEVVRAIRDHLRESPDEVRDSQGILADLAAMEKILEAAGKRGVRFRLSVDYGP